MRACSVLLSLAVLLAVAVAQNATPQWFDQRVDHFDHQNEATFKQLYYVNDTWWNPSLPGPVFLSIGGEGPLSPLDVSYFQEANYAQRFGALLVSLEHRFYGQSQPTGDITTKSLKLLSSQQALADLADFIHHIKSEYNCPNSLVVTFGCSYSGALAAWFRMKYPEITVGSIAGSAPVHAVADFYEYMDVVDQSLSYFTGAQCDALIRNATAQIESMLKSPQGVAMINQMFNLCTPLNVSNWLDVATFMSTLMGNFQGVVQYNDDNRLVKPPIDVTGLCDMMIAGASTPLATYANISNWFLKQANVTCLDPLYNDSLVDIQNTTVPNDAARQWVYQTCTEFGFFQTTDSPAQPFGNLVPLKYYEEMCKDAYGIHFHNESIKQTNRYYGSNKIPAWGPTNIMFVNGHNDPWHTLSVTQDVSSTVTAILIENTAHCAHEYPSSPTDSPGLIAARQAVEAQIANWLYL